MTQQWPQIKYKDSRFIWLSSDFVCVYVRVCVYVWIQVCVHMCEFSSSSCICNSSYTKTCFRLPFAQFCEGRVVYRRVSISYQQDSWTLVPRAPCALEIMCWVPVLLCTVSAVPGMNVGPAHHILDNPFAVELPRGLKCAVGAGPSSAPPKTGTWEKMSRAPVQQWLGNSQSIPHF